MNDYLDNWLSKRQVEIDRSPDLPEDFKLVKAIEELYDELNTLQNNHFRLHREHSQLKDKYMKACETVIELINKDNKV